MPEYIVTPEKKELPSATRLMEELHHRGFPVEIHLEGSAQEWTEVRFYEPGPPEMETLLSNGGPDGKLKISVSRDSPPRAKELQLSLVGLLLGELGGQVDISETREQYSAREFSARMKKQAGSARKTKDLLWMVFTWAVVAAGITFFFASPTARGAASVVILLSFLSALGLTYTHFKP